MATTSYFLTGNQATIAHGATVEFTINGGWASAPNVNFNDWMPCNASINASGVEGFDCRLNVLSTIMGQSVPTDQGPPYVAYVTIGKVIRDEWASLYPEDTTTTFSGACIIVSD